MAQQQLAYVAFDQVEQWLRKGWMVVTATIVHPVLDCRSVLMVKPCACPSDSTRIPLAENPAWNCQDRPRSHFGRGKRLDEEFVNLKKSIDAEPIKSTPSSDFEDRLSAILEEDPELSWHEAVHVILGEEPDHGG
jgi:hypothetical protein